MTDLNLSIEQQRAMDFASLSPAVQQLAARRLGALERAELLAIFKTIRFRRLYEALGRVIELEGDLEGAEDGK